MKVLVIETLGLRLDFLGCYGNDWIDTPAVDRLAAEGAVFDRHFVDDFGFTPRPCETGRYAINASCRRPPTSAEELRKHGIHVAWDEAVQPIVKDDPFGFQRVLNRVEEMGENAEGIVWARTPGLCPPWAFPEEWFEYAMSAFPDATEEAGPWREPPLGRVDDLDDSDRLRLQDTYAAVIVAWDAQLGEFLARLYEIGWTDHDLLVITSTCGLPLGEHGIIGIERSLAYEELVHIPLFVKWPAEIKAGMRVSSITQPVDLFPTLLSIFGMQVPECHGHNLLPLLKRQGASSERYAASRIAAGDAEAWSLRNAQWAYVAPFGRARVETDCNPQLYVKPDDRWEVNDLAAHHLERVEIMDRFLCRIVQAAADPGPWHPPQWAEIEQQLDAAEPV